MENFWKKNKKIIMIVGGIVAFVLLAIGVYSIIWNNIYSAKINMIVAPSIARVKVGDDYYSAQGEYNIKPGEYAVEVSADGFITKTGNLVAVSGETVNIAIYLEPTDENSDWYNTHSADALIMGEIKNNETVRALQELGEEYPILNILPYEAEYFTEDYSAKIKYTVSYKTNAEDNSFVITITDYMGGAKEIAYKWLEENGVNAEEYNIEYKDISAEWLITGSAN